MFSTRTHFHQSEKMVPNVMVDQKVPVLTYAACEWFLIFLMLIDALLSYLLISFARYCRLQMPCFLCSKILHPLHWRFLICRDHRTEVSSYMSCLNHDNKLAECRGMCNDCLLSFTKTTGPNPDTNRLLLGKLGYDLLSTNHFAHLRSCSCCNKPWRARHHTQRLIRLGSRGRNSSNKPNIPAPRHLTRRGSVGSLKKMRDYRPATSASEYVDVGSRSDGMAHAGSESEFLFTDDDAFLQMTDFNVDPPERPLRKSRSRTSFEEKKMSKRKQPYVKENKEKNNTRVKDYKNVGSSMRERKVVDKTRKQQPVPSGEHAAVIFELITMSEARPFSLDLPQEDSVGSATQNDNETEPSGNSSPSGGEFLSPRENSASQEIQIQEHDDSADFVQNISDLDVKIEASDAAMEQKVSVHLPDYVADDEEDGAEGDFKPLASAEQSSVEEKEVSGNNVAEEYFSNEEVDEVNAHSEPSKSKDVSGSAEEQSSEEEDGSNDYSVAKSHSSHEPEDVDNEDSEPLTSNNATGSATEEHSHNKDHEETEPLTSPKLSNEENSCKEEHGDDHEETEPLTSPKLSNEEPSLEHSNKDSSKVTETQSTSNETPELKQSPSVESFGSISTDIEGESLVDMLKQQLEYERKCLRELSKELDEERNASAIATNEAMAMITRLQEEKAALQMEALQYLRMMDEQAEHDVDALERANDVLADREKEIQDLEMELEYYRVKYPDEPREEILASMGVLENVETSGDLETDETSEKVPTDTKLTGSPSAGI